MDNYLNRSCVEACYQCATACDLCAAACLEESDPGAMAHCIKLDIDCAAVCRTTAGLVSRNSDLLEMAAKLCEEMCEECGRECAQHSAQHCQDCAAACRACAQECRNIAGHLPGSRTQQQAQAGRH